jgi:hypothetical protein
MLNYELEMLKHELGIDKILEKVTNIEKMLIDQQCKHEEYVRLSAQSNMTHCPTCGEFMRIGILR